METSKKSELRLVAVAVVGGLGYIGSAMTVRSGITPFQFLLWRYTISVAIMSVMFRNELKKITKAEIKNGIIIGIFLVLSFSFKMAGIKYTTVSNNAFLWHSKVVMIPFLYWLLFHKKPDMHSVIGVILAVTGASIMMLDKSIMNISKGDYLTLCGAFFSACNMVVSSNFLTSKDGSPENFTFVQFCVMVIAMIFVIPFDAPRPEINLNTGIIIFFMAIGPTLFNMLSINKALKYTTPVRSSIIVATESVFGTVFSAIVLNEAITLRMALGGVILFLALIITVAKPKLPFLKEKTV